jgi:hypothetical protein
MQLYPAVNCVALLTLFIAVKLGEVWELFSWEVGSQLSWHSWEVIHSGQSWEGIIKIR